MNRKPLKLLRTPIGDCVDDDTAPEVEMEPYDDGLTVMESWTTVRVVPYEGEIEVLE